MALSCRGQIPVCCSAGIFNKWRRRGERKVGRGRSKDHVLLCYPKSSRETVPFFFFQGKGRVAIEESKGRKERRRTLAIKE